MKKFARITTFRGYKGMITGVEKTENNGKSWTLIAATTKTECEKILKELNKKNYKTWDGVPW